jgi:hypothetical protein
VAHCILLWSKHHGPDYWFDRRISLPDLLGMEAGMRPEETPGSAVGTAAEREYVPKSAKTRWKSRYLMPALWV